LEKKQHYFVEVVASMIVFFVSVLKCDCVDYFYCWHNWDYYQCYWV